MPVIETPCINVCIVEPVSGLCRGCARSLNEIAGWLRLSPEERHHIMASLPSRRLRMQGDGTARTDPA